MSKPLFLPQVGFVREAVVLPHVPWGRTKFREEIRAGRFPAPQRFSERVVAFDAAKVHRWIAEQQSAGEKAAS